MALDLTGLAAYTDEIKQDLIRESLLKAKTISLITVQPDIKSASEINILSSSPIWRAGACGFSNTGTTSLTNRAITVCSITKNESLCINDLESYWIQTRMKPGSYNQELPFEQLYSEEVVGQTQKFIEQLTWQGNAGSSNNNLGLCDGFIQVIDDEVGTIVTGSTAVATAVTSSTIVDEVDAMVAAIPADVVDAEDLVLFMGYDRYRLYSTALRDANLFHYTGAENQGEFFEQMVPGTNVKVMGVGGLVGQNRMFLGEASNFFVGTDLLNDAEMFSIFYSQDNDEVRVIQKYKLGFQVAFPTRIVKNLAG